MLCRLFFLAVLYTTSHSWVLNATDNVVAKKISPNVTLECFYDGNDNNSPKLQEVTRVRISKFNKNNRWVGIAKISETRPIVETSLLDADVTGHAETSSNSFLKIVFPTASMETVGQFICEILGYDVNEDIVNIKTKPILITERGINYDDMLDILLNLKNEEETDYNDLQLKLALLKKSVILQETKGDSISNLIVKNTNRISVISEEHEQLMKIAAANISKQFVNNLIMAATKEESEIREKHDNEMQTLMTNVSVEIRQEEETIRETHENDIKKLLSKFTDISDQINKRITEEISTLKEELTKQRTAIVILQKDPSVVWPTGRYGLLKPDSGCPDSPSFQWANGSIRVTTRAGATNDDQISDPSHIGGTVLQHESLTNYNFVKLESCTSLYQYDGPAWPAGHYCVMAVSGTDADVPGFTYGVIQLDRQDTEFTDEVINLRKDLSTQVTDFYFWCRKDGDASVPIVLPTKDPFYLFRIGGTCQTVQGMDVANEWVFYDTMGSDKDYGYPHPDGSINKAKIELCYYTPQ